MTADTTAAPRRAPQTPTWAVVTIAALFGLFYAYAVWNAVDFLVAQATGALSLNAYGWFVLLLAVVFPLIAFGIAFALGWRRVWWHFALVLVTGLAVVAVFWLNIVAYSAVAGAAMLG
ncbi:bacitracin resistance protein [Microbacterium aurum]|uniref:Bacitracin resistance protein n=1 Tax=Microbacterium aurum TaxID=36805 RepID=A0A1P8U7W9_9MICO|nr:bacitracin resistance protein [Microbacterium aurum]APZ34218.1 bacitracin resistance protein [Microbacterium aurum]MBM7828049.1 glucan phosphoethanolaminetransferase (alkaline phosphatase superfamily) [Microbacterium aurum]